MEHLEGLVIVAVHYLCTQDGQTMIYVADVKSTQDYMKRRTKMSRMGDYYEEMKENGNWSEADEYYKNMWEDKEEGPIKRKKEKEINNGDKKLNNIY
jgi:heterodisulfide reductase subunit A-like polyferredoxin